MNKLLLHLIAGATLLYSCKTEKKEEVKMILPEKSWRDFTWDELSQVKIEEVDDMTLDSVGVFKMRVDELTNNPIIYPVYYENGKEQFLVHYNEVTNSLDILDMNGKKTKKRISYEAEGPVAVGRNSRPYIKSADSIFVWSWNPSMILLIDKSGKQQDVFIYPDSLENISINMVQQYFAIGNKLVLAYRPGYQDFRLRNSSNYVVYDLTSRTVSRSKVGRPLSVSNFPLYASDAMPRIFKGQNNSIVNFFGAGQLIMQSSLDSDSVKQFILRSKYLPKTYSSPKYVDGNIIQTFARGNYHMMVYDPYNKYYYLMCLLGLSPDDPDPENPDKKELSIIIADTLFKKRGEMILPKNTYFRSMIVTRDGLLISNANPNNKDHNQGTLSYTVFKPVLKK